CKTKYSDDANFCPREECAGPGGPQRLVAEAEVEAAAPVRFVPVSRIGGGASGEVWQASDAQTGSAVAYKIVAAESLPTATALERAQRELRQLQRANNPHIVKVVEFGKTTEGRLFVASELASGEPLDQVVSQSGPFPMERAKRIAAQIGEALLEAQKVGVVHRDLAAKNILVSADDQVRIINFAIPRPLLDNVFGVPEYMSPEQSEGKLIDQRSNTYSLGALLYLMLTGNPPHTGESARAVLDAIQKGDITPPSIKRAAGVSGGGGLPLTAEVDRILLKAMERNSSRRPLTMRQFLNDVSGLIVTVQSAPAAASAGGGRDNAFARTMMFAGGASEVQKLVAQAVAARQVAGNGAPESAAAAAPAAPAAAEPSRAPLAETPVPHSGGPIPSTASVTPSPVDAAAPAAPAAVALESRSGATVSPSQRPAHGAAVAATMIAMPAAAPAFVPGAAAPAGVIDAASGQLHQPASSGPNTATPPPRSAGTTPPPSGPDSPNFRETLWFKKGDVDQMIADARTKMAALATANAAKKEAEIPTEDAKPLQERYVDDGTVTVDDHQKFSLGSGRASTSQATRAGSVPGERMTEEEMLDEIGGGKRVLIIGIVAAVLVALVAVIALSVKGGGKDKKISEPAAAVSEPAAVPPPPPPPPPVPPPTAAPAAVAPPPPPPTPKVKAPVAEPRAEPASRPTPKKHSAAVKHKAAPAAKKHR
ncbi:MAG: serine/threonine-protein kinase, partial [Myxococcales bacterium]